MTPQELLGSQRSVYVLAEKPGSTDAVAKQYWYMKLDGLHSEQLKSSVAQLRKQKCKGITKKSDERALKSKGLQDALARALGAKSYDDWLDNKQPKVMTLLAEHGLTEPTDLIKWKYPPGFAGALQARQVSDRIFNSNLPRPQRIFTGVGSHLFAPSGYGRLDIDEIAGRSMFRDTERYDFCRRHLDEVLLRAKYVKREDGPEFIDMTGRTLMLNAVSEYVGCIYNMLGDNLATPAATPPEFNLYKASEDEIDFQLKIFELFREEIERHDVGWVDVIPVPGNENLAFLKGPNGTFDWVIRDQRDVELTSNPLHPFFKKDEVPTAMDKSQIAALRYFTIGEWQEKVMHEAALLHKSPRLSGARRLTA